VAFAERVFECDDVRIVLQGVWRFIRRRAGGQADANEEDWTGSVRVCARVCARVCYYGHSYDFIFQQCPIKLLKICKPVSPSYTRESRR
jgi:hypothetical protein